MADEDVRVEQQGSLLCIEVPAGVAGGSSVKVQVSAAALTSALLETLDLRLFLSASGVVALRTEILPYELENGKDKANPATAVPIDELTHAMTKAVLDAPDEEDAAALKNTLRRLERASTFVQLAIRKIAEP